MIVMVLSIIIFIMIGSSQELPRDPGHNGAAGAAMGHCHRRGAAAVLGACWDMDLGRVCVYIYECVYMTIHIELLIYDSNYSIYHIDYDWTSFWSPIRSEQDLRTKIVNFSKKCSRSASTWSFENIQ